MLTITADISSLSQGQREALSSFVLSYPQVDSLGMLVPDAKSCEVISDHVQELSPEVAFAHAYAVGDIASPVTVLPASAIAAPNVDKSGLPWDERIHSSSKNLTADGLWRKKRGVDDALVSQVEGQLKAMMSVPSQTVPAVTISGVDPVDGGSYFSRVEIPAPVSAQVPPPPPPAPLAQEVLDARQAYIKLVGKVSTAIQEKKLSQEELKQILEKWGVPTLALLMTARPDLIPSVAMDIEALIVTR